MNTKVAVTSKSFSKNPFLREALLKVYPNSKFNDQGLNFTNETLIEFLKGYDKAIIGLEKINSEVLEALPNLILVSKYGVGLDNMDLKALLQKDVLLSWTGGVNRRGVAELALCFMINVIRGVNLTNKKLLGGTWAQHIGFGLREVKVGLIGLGHIGQELAPILRFMGVEVWAYDIMDKNEFASRHGIKFASFEDVLKNCDVVSLHIPHTEKTHLIMNDTRLKIMKKGSFLINTSRGGIVDEEALYENLISGHLAAAAFDVFMEEPCRDEKLLNLENFLATSHIAGSSRESVIAMGLAAIEGLEKGKKAEHSNFFNF